MTKQPPPPPHDQAGPATSKQAPPLLAPCTLPLHPNECKCTLASFMSA